MFKAFIGWDAREEVAYDVCKHSILTRSSIPVEVIPIKQGELRESGVYTRPVDTRASTDFSLTRFFTPFLSNFSGPSLFSDCDFLYLCDMKEILDLYDPKYAVQVVKHNYTPSEEIKMDGRVQYQYPRKNWSSFIIFNSEHPSNKVLTPDFLNKADSATLHRFLWLKDEEIGELNCEYNWLEGHCHEPKDGKPKVIHYTRGNVYFKDFQDVEYAEVWKSEFEKFSGKKWIDDYILNK
jgi:hypothetical protein